MSDDLPPLVDRCLAGEQRAMIALVDRYRGQVFGLCYRMLGHRQDAEDAAQEAFVRVLRTLHRWDRERPFEPWLLAIAGNRCRTALAKRSRRPAVQSLTEPIRDPSPAASGGNYLAEEVALGLKRLRPEYRQAFVLLHENELSYAEIARAMRCPVGTIKTWVHRARRSLVGHLRRRGVLEDSPSPLRQSAAG